MPEVAPVLHLRLTLDASGVALLRRDAADLLQPARRPVTRKLRQVFWDTADFRLGRAGFALFRQGTGARQLQLVRDIRRSPMGGRIVAEQDGVAVGEGFDLTRLAFLPGADPALTTGLTEADLLPIFAIDLTRTVWKVALGQSAVAVVLEHAEIEAAAGRATHDQLDLVHEAGAPDTVYALAGRLAPALGAGLAGHDPIQLGYRLVSGTDWWVTGPAELVPEMTLREAVLAIGRAATAEFRTTCAALLSGTEPEAIHQARVAIRRLRSLLSVFRPVLPPAARATLAQGLGTIATLLGHAREWDVQLAETLLPLSASLGRDGDLAGLIEGAQTMRDRAAGAVRPAVSDQAFLAVSLSLGSWFDAGLWPDLPDPAALDGPLVDFAGAVLRRRHRRLVRAAADLDPAQLHALRIEAKKLRYTAEFLRSLYPAKRVKPYLAALRDIQDRLGAAHDAVVARFLLSQFGSADDPVAARAAGQVIGWSAAQADAARRGFDQAWQDFLAAPRFWKG